MIRSRIAQLGNSRSIFKLSVNSNKSRIESKLVERYIPTADPEDEISVLICDRYSENLRGESFVKNFDDIERGVLNHIKGQFKLFVVKYGGFKNAKQSGVHRFLNTYSTPKGAEDGLVYLYKYARSHGMGNGLIPSSTDQKHINNILAILELMRSKFEQK